MEFIVDIIIITVCLAAIFFSLGGFLHHIRRMEEIERRDLNNDTQAINTSTFDDE